MTVWTDRRLRAHLARHVAAQLVSIRRASEEQAIEAAARWEAQRGSEHVARLEDMGFPPDSIARRLTLTTDRLEGSTASPSIPHHPPTPEGRSHSGPGTRRRAPRGALPIG